MTFQLQIDKGSQIESRVAIATGFLGQSRTKHSKDADAPSFTE
jgi:hypothetical protein